MSLSTLQQHWARAPRASWLLEDYIAGREFHCNGQVDAEGNICVFEVAETQFKTANGSVFNRARFDQTPSHAKEFRPIADYARQVIAASGLRRSPFHAEVQLDDQGPCLIECGARLVGGNWGFLINKMHGSKFDIFKLTAHYYASDQPFGEIELDWTEYDRNTIFRIATISERAECIETLTGTSAVESMPEFISWNAKPFVGQTLTVTRDLFSRVYSASFQYSSSAEIDETAALVEKLITWNTSRPSLAAKLRIWIGRGQRFLARKYKKVAPAPAFGDRRFSA
ncbi:MAG: ATP-grasp domain-containing protein [Candidatus Synoicihabitans palmerolidicus]|nr:ATP-grasp domain-containing protein [Candidatus Synoicihabitans palmerolidicus]